MSIAGKWVVWLALLSVPVVAAASEDGLAELLREKGLISAEECTAVSAVGPVKSLPRINGRIMYDVAAYESDDAEFSNGGEIRRGRLTVGGVLDEDWFYRLQYEFTGSGSAGFQDVYFGYDVNSAVRVRVGQYAGYGSLEDLTSSKYITFMERALPVIAFVPAEWRLGAGIETHGDSWSLAGGVFGENAGVDETQDDGVGLMGRMTWAPLHESARVLHVGLHGNWREPRGDKTVRYRARPEAHVDDSSLVDTGAITNITRNVICGIEAACVYGPFSLQGEYLAVNVGREELTAEDYSGYYLFASWLLTGESRPYDVAEGIFGRIKPAKPLGQGGAGAWELALRYSSLDLSDTVQGGRQNDITAGLNWHPTAHVRFMLNYVNASATRAGRDTDVDIVQMRAQVDF